MKKWMWFPLFLVLAMLLANALVLLQIWRPRKVPGAGLKHLVVNELELNEQQKKAFFEDARKHHQSMRSLDKKQEVFLQAYFLGDSLENAYALDSLAAVQTQKIKVTERHFQFIESLCNAEQLLRFPELKETMVLHLLGRPPLHHPPGRH